MVNGPVLLFICGPLFVFGHLIETNVISRSYNWIGFVVFIVGFIVAWLWWPLSVPKWRLWAMQRVDDISELKERAVGAGLTWPDGHFFERTEIKSKEHELRERETDNSK